MNVSVPLNPKSVTKIINTGTQLYVPASASGKIVLIFSFLTMNYAYACIIKDALRIITTTLIAKCVYVFPNNLPIF